MADNYLENKMEEYRRQTPRPAHHTPRLHGAGEGLPLAGVRVLVDGGGTLTDALAALVDAFVDAGCRVAFRCADAAAGNRLAQTNGARALPLDADRSVENLFRAWGGIDILVADADAGYAEHALSRCRRGRGRHLTLADMEGAAAADIVRMCS